MSVPYKSSIDIKIIELFDAGLGSRKIADRLKISRWAVQQAYKRLGVYNIGRKNPCKPTPTMKNCKICGQFKCIAKFRERIKNNKIYYESYCLPCEKKYRQNCCKKYYKKNATKIKQYNKTQRKQINKMARARYKKPTIKLRRIISHSIRTMLFKNGSSKIGKSCLKYLSYTVNELKNNIESKFEPWMNWDNHGGYYIATWDDDDISTWTWQIDHIIPQSQLPYDSMNHSNFKKC